jgi:hypothetical protein
MKEAVFGAGARHFLGAGIQTARQAVEYGLIGDVTSCFAVLNRDYGYLRDLIPFPEQAGRRNRIRCGHILFDCPYQHFGIDQRGFRFCPDKLARTKA